MIPHIRSLLVVLTALAFLPVAALADRPYQSEMTEAQQRQAIQAYHATISFMDEQLGKVLNALDSNGLAEDTLVVFLSDHGYQLGSHGLWQKKDLFENSLRTPLVMVAPGQLEAGERSHALVELVDIYPTLVALAEEGWVDGAIARSIVHRYLDESHAASPDTIILGCTHFPLLANTIRNVAGDQVGIVDSAGTTAAVVRATIDAMGMRRESDDSGTLRLLAIDGTRTSNAEAFEPARPRRNLGS